jgi:F-box and WD-40 domain protein CDC4
VFESVGERVNGRAQNNYRYVSQPVSVTISSHLIDTSQHILSCLVLCTAGREGSVYCMVQLGKTLFASVTGNDIKMLDLPDLTPAATLSGHTGTINDLVVRGRKLFSGASDHTVRVWDVMTATSIGVLEGHTDAVLKLLVHGRFLYSSSADCTVRVWSIRQLLPVAELIGHTDKVGVCA